LEIRGQDKCRITSGAIDFLKKKTKYTWKDHEIIEDIFSEFKINPVEKKIQNNSNKSIQYIRRIDSHRLPHLIMK